MKDLDITTEADLIVQHFFNLGARCGVSDLNFVKDKIDSLLSKQRKEVLEELPEAYGWDVEIGEMPSGSAKSGSKK